MWWHTLGFIEGLKNDQQTAVNIYIIFWSQCLFTIPHAVVFDKAKLINS